MSFNLRLALLACLLLAACRHGGNHAGGGDTAAAASLACDTCHIQLHVRVVLGRDDDPAPLQLFSAPHAFRQGEYLVVPTGDLSQIARYDSMGKALEPVGRAGDGPGEFRRIRDLAPRPDGSVVVLSERLTVLAPDLRFVRTVPLTRRASSIVSLGDGRVVLNTYSVPGRPFLIFGQNFDTVVTAGDSASADPDQLQYVLASDGSGGFWSARRTGAYRLEHWDANGNRLGVIAPGSAWFSTGTQRRSLAETDAFVEPPEPRISGIWLDQQDRLWVVASVPDRHWKPWRPASSSGNRPPSQLPGPEDYAALMDGIIEVVDASTGQVISTRRYRAPLGVMPGALIELLEARSGGIRFQVIEPGLHD